MKVDEYNTRRTLISRIRDRDDDEAWEEFVQIYRRYIYAIIRNMNISEADADDLVQTVLIKLMDSCSKQDMGEIRRFRSWLSTMTRNCVIDFIRKRSMEAERFEMAVKEDEMAYLKDIRLPDIEQIAEREWGVHLANMAMENIKPLFSGKAIKVFQLNLDGVEIAEIAKKMNLKENSVYRLRNRVKARLISEIEELRKEYE
ncbi:sigma-70 family RNA polymerase sigma factor [Pontiellaceae bacterium B12227]|nr:sigma-70 family RNA polymerase sigma factor [Pontiellaceae bacterium B12227]